MKNSRPHLQTWKLKTKDFAANMKRRVDYRIVVEGKLKKTAIHNELKENSEADNKEHIFRIKVKISFFKHNSTYISNF
jgi:hypothetical protein